MDAEIKENQMRYIYLLLLMTVSAYGQVNVPPPTDLQCPPAVCPPTTCAPCVEEEFRFKTQDYRNDSFGQVMLGYQYVDTWVVGKSTISYTQIISRGWSLELEYAGSKRDVKIFDANLGEVKEERLTMLAKFYIGNSFHFSFGAFLRNILIETEGRLQDRFGNRFNDELELESNGLALAFGNRWQTRWGLTYGVDWLRINFPLNDGKVKQRFVELSEESQEKVDRAFKILKRLPSFSVVGVNIGYTF